jgi:hypothetical protein
MIIAKPKESEMIEFEDQNENHHITFASPKNMEPINEQFDENKHFETF